MTMKFAAVCAALLFATPAAAQDLVFDMGATLACIEGADSSAVARGCIGTSADACMSANLTGGSTVGMGGCLNYELTYWDDRLNVAYRALRAAEEADDAAGRGSFGYVPKAEALREMQQTWIRFRNATCDYERAQWGGGTGGGPATAGCMLRMTGEQVLYLEAMAADY